MFTKLRQLFEAPESSDTDNPHLAHLAATALLIEVCHADHYEDPQEVENILSTACNVFGISDEEIETFFSEAKLSKLEATSLYQFTDIINRHFDENQKISLIGEMWKVAYSDGSIDRHEDHMIRKVADLIYVSHSDFIKTKLQATDS